ncbi:DUF2933 domain-containing protein [Streptomyces sp. XD-27]|uniref:DUF2933 domain-containing protein n=1 Tax=Streptomyces sp. XD-27 TaxID=3062779 RepID=UPI0026F44A00|nr:DUF2933 domain-containing protein [Streptomyces sp. XD-27]WKX68994.1 DUF2933 domain-containing protein [Streptomyces sp. XD-27]
MSNTKNYGLYALALAIVVVGTLALGVPAETLFVLAVVAMCPLMMFFMMRGMHGDGGKHSDESGPPHERDQHQQGSGRRSGQASVP